MMTEVSLLLNNYSILPLTNKHNEDADYIVEDKEDILRRLNDEFADALLPVSIFVGTEIILGFFGNLSVLYVFIFRYHDCNFRDFVICLSLNDLLGSLTVMPGEILGQWYWYNFPTSELCKVKTFFNLFTILSETWCLLVIAIDRYRKVCRPFSWQIKSSLAKVLCGCILLLSCLVSFPVLLLSGTYKTETHYMNMTIMVTICGKDENVVNTKGPYILVIVRFFQSIMPTSIVVMLLVYVLIIYNIVKQRRCENKIKTCPKPVICGKPIDKGKEQIKTVTNKNYSSIQMDGPNKDRSTVASFSDIPKNMDDTDGEMSAIEITRENSEAADLHSAKKHSRTLGKDVERKTSNFSKKKGKRVPGIAKRKTKIMFILGFVFFVTTIVYLVLIDYISKPERILEKMSNSKRAMYFFFLRLVFINHVINPFVYGMLDKKYKTIIFSFFSSFKMFKR